MRVRLNWLRITFFIAVEVLSLSDLSGRSALTFVRSVDSSMAGGPRFLPRVVLVKEAPDVCNELLCS